MPGYPSDSPLEKALANPAVPEALKELHLRILPGKDVAALQQMMSEGRINPLDSCAACPALSPINQILLVENKEKKKEFLKALFSTCPEKFSLAHCTMFRDSYGHPRLPDFSGNAAREKVSLGLADYLARYISLTPAEILEISPFALLSKTEDGRGFAMRMSPDIALFEKLAAKWGTDFLDARNDRGETLVHILLACSGEERTRLDLLSWVLMKKPHLASVQDNLGWTPLDRHIAGLTVANADNATTRLLVTFGASFNRQLAPGFNLAAEVKERQSLTLDKPAPAQRKTPGLGGAK
jgi:hypothetical protein